MKKLTLIFVLNFVTISLFAQLQYVEYGLGCSYNFQSGGIGADLRGEVIITKKISVTPHIAYFPGINPIHEAYIGIDGNYHFLTYKKFTYYGLIGTYYNYWINFDKYDESVAKKDNLTFEVGVGAEMQRKCFSPFIETRFSSKWKESFLIVGVKYCMANCNSRYHAIRCPDF